MVSAITQADTPPATPADRSMSPSSSTNTSPIASTQIDPAWVTRLARLSADRNRSLARPNTTNSTTRPRIAGSEPMSPPRTRCR